MVVHALANENINCSIEWLIQGNGAVASRQRFIGLKVKNDPSSTLRVRAAYYKKIKTLNNKLILAIKNNKIETVRGLILEGANLHKLTNIELYLFDRKEYTALHYASRYGGKTLVQMFVDLGLNPNIRNRDFDTPLHLAAYEGNHDAIAKLLNLGASIECTNSEGTTPIMWAAQAGKTATITYLVSLGAQVNYTDFMGRTAAHWAAFHGNSGSLEMLYKLGAYLDVENYEGKTPLDVAIINGHIQALEAILLVTGQG